MLTKQGYKVEARTGKEFEFEVLRDASLGQLMLPKEPFSQSLRACMVKRVGDYPRTWAAQTLHSFVRDYLKSQAVIGELIFFKSVNTSADLHHETDAFFYFKVGEHESIVTIDLFFVSADTIAKDIFGRLKEYSSWPFDSASKIVRSILTHGFLINPQYYLDFQVALYAFKKSNFQSPVLRSGNGGRWENHFILTPLDIERSRGLRTLARNIAEFLANDIKQKQQTRARS